MVTALFSGVFVVIFLLAGCAVPKGPVYDKDGKRYGITRGAFAGHWWNYYERGTSYAKGGYWEDAIRDYREALRVRGKDQRRARTYGLLNFIDYFPHRELGVSLYHLGRYEEAAQELECSLKDTESAKAIYYLNRTNRAILLRDKKDTKAPMIQVLSPARNELIRDYEIEVQGEVRDDFFVATVQINGQNLTVELAQPVIRFQHKVLLGKADKEIRIDSQDLVGRHTTNIVKLRVDREGPQLGLEEVQCMDPASCAQAILKGYVDDASEIAWFSIDQKKIFGKGQTAIDFEQAVPLGTAARTIQFAAEDIVGNRTEGEIRIPLPGQPGTDTESPLSGLVRLALAGYVKTAFDWGTPLIEQAISGPGTVDPGTASGMLAGSIIDWKGRPRKMEPEDAFPPEITLRDLTEEQTVYYPTIYLEGNILASAPIRRLLVDGLPILRRQSSRFFFSHFLHLKPGENEIVLRVEDTRGNVTEQTFHIFYRIPRVHQLECRLRVSVLPFTLRGEQDFIGDFFYDALLSAFVIQNRFRLVDRADLEKLLFELELGQKDLSDPETAARVGKLAAAEAVISGSVYEGRNSLEIFAQLMDPETSEVILSKDVYHEEKDLKTIRTLSEGLALKFKLAMPVIEGEVVNLKGRDIYTDLGQEEQILPGMRFLVFREGEQILHPRTGKPLGCETLELAEAVVKGVYEDMSVGELIKERQRGEVNLLDFVIMK